MATVAGKLCHACSVVTVVLTVWVYARTNIEGRHTAVTPGYGVVTEHTHFQMATFILGTAWVLEFLEISASAAHGVDIPEDVDCKDVVPRSHFVRWSDSQLMLVVYSVLFASYLIMAAGSFGLVLVDPFASKRAVYGLRCVEWSITVPILMTLVGRSIPRSLDAAVPDLLPAILVTIVYIYSSLLAIIIDDYTWRMVLIVVSFVGYALASWDQYNWTIGLDRKAPTARLSCGLLLFQVVLFGIYGAVYILAAYDCISPMLEQALYTFGDATAKVGHSAALLANRQQLILAAVRVARQEAAIKSADLSRLIDAASAPILSIDLAGHILTWNRKLVELTGHSVEVMQGTQFLDVVSPACRAEMTAAIECAKDDRDSSKGFHTDLLAALADDDEGSACEGERKTVSLIMNLTPQRDSAGVTAGVVCVGQDQTEVVQYKAVEERKNRFMATVSHELRSPLHGICGLAAGLEGSEADEKRRRQIAMVRSCATRLLDLVANIMDMSSQRNGRHKTLPKDPVHLSAILEEVVALISSATDKAMKPLLSEDCSIINKVADTDLPLIEGDSYKLTQVFFNLLTNACKFCRAGQIVVAAETDLVRRVVRISVSDTGIGIAPKALKRIFEPFEQEDSSSGRRFEGIGIGLSVSEGVVKQHGGEISVGSVQGQGSTFTVSLPFVAESVPVLRRPSRQSSRQSRPSLSPPMTTPSSPCELTPGPVVQVSSEHAPCLEITAARPVVLSVDDDVVNQEVILSALPDYEVRTAMDGPAALSYFANHSRLPDVVLLDVMMPGMTGYEVCAQIRNQLQLPPSILPIIMLSAKDPVPNSIIEGLENGCNDYIAKPFESSVLQARVKTALQLKRLHEVEVQNAQHANLLHEIMPAHIVQRLISGENCISESHHCVTILFSDIVGWTNIAESIPTSSVIMLLNELFSAFDALLDKYGVYKVETIGDAYMVAAGHDGCIDHAKRVMLMGLAMLEAVRGVRPPPNMRLQIRVGIHSGPAFTGVVGQKVPRFCFFGDTVNVSSRMESNGVPSCIHISQAARAALGDVDLNGARIVSRGPIDVKGKGRMETYFIVPSGVAMPLIGQSEDGQSRSLSRRQTLGPGDIGGNTSKLLQEELAEANAAMAELRLERDELCRRTHQLEQAVHNAKVAAATLPPAHSTPRRLNDSTIRPCTSQNHESTRGSSSSTSADANHSALRLELAVKKKALERARRALMHKDDELDAKELELQQALTALNDAGIVHAGASKLLLLSNSCAGALCTIPDLATCDEH